MMILPSRDGSATPEGRALCRTAEGAKSHGADAADLPPVRFPILRGVVDKWREIIIETVQAAGQAGSLFTYKNEQRRQIHMLSEDWYFKRGDIYLANLNPYRGSEQGGTRPVLVLQNNVGNLFCPTIIVAPITSHVFKKPHQPTHYLLENAGKLKTRSIVQLEQIKTIDKRRVMKYLGKIDGKDMAGIEGAILASLGFEIPAEMEAP